MGRPQFNQPREVKKIGAAIWLGVGGGRLGAGDVCECGGYPCRFLAVCLRDLLLYWLFKLLVTWYIRTTKMITDTLLTC